MVVVLCTLVTCSSQDVLPEPTIKVSADLSSAQDTELDEDDIAVTRAAIIGFLTSGYGVPYNMTHGGVRMVLRDRTIRVCDLVDYRPFAYVCITPSEQQTLDRLLAASHGAGGVRLFHDRNAQSSVIRHQIDPQFQLVPSTGLLDMLQRPWERPFAEWFPDRHGIVMVSAPIYPAARQAVLYVLHVVHSAGYVELVRHEQVWNVHAVRGLWIQ